MEHGQGAQAHGGLLAEEDDHRPDGDDARRRDAHDNREGHQLVRQRVQNPPQAGDLVEVAGDIAVGHVGDKGQGVHSRRPVARRGAGLEEYHRKDRHHSQPEQGEKIRHIHR